MQSDLKKLFAPLHISSVLIFLSDLNVLDHQTSFIIRKRYIFRIILVVQTPATSFSTVPVLATC